MRHTDLSYLLAFLLGASPEHPQHSVSYTSDIAHCSGPVVIIPSGFFDDDIYGTTKSLPALPLAEFEGVPLLFGQPRVEKQGGKLLIYADLVASSYFLLTRYEEMVRPTVRDAHGRFPGTESLPYRAGCIQRPLVDEYGGILRHLLRKFKIADFHDPQPGFEHIYLSHDIDIPWEHFSLWGALRRVGGTLIKEHRLSLYPLANTLAFPEGDPQYTFPQLIALDHRVSAATSLYFVKSGGTSFPEDAAAYIRSAACKRLLRKLHSSGAILGYHASYSCGCDPQKISEELAILRAVSPTPILYQRNHYLCNREPQDFHQLLENGITDDFTMGYADVAGFRLGTARPVQWIDPADGALTKLRLHPLTMMDCTLTSECYMNLSLVEAQQYAMGLIHAVERQGGELTLLWHNTSVMNGAAELPLYEQLIQYLSKL